MNGFTLLLALGAGAAFFVVLRRLAFLEQELRRVESRIAGAPAPVALAEPPAPPPAALIPIVQSGEDAPSPSGARFSLETLIGERLPIWIGGAALVLAGFFLVRYSIESGLLGPGARTLLAALFALALIGASEAARRLPATRNDPRVAQSLAGAGVASLYATLFLAVSLYHLISAPVAFAAAVTVTGLALALSLRHGPPTAAMALAGGFMAPLLAGFDGAGIGPLLVYLTLVVAALFGLALRRGWGWLALAASIAGFVWINFLILAFAGRPAELSAVGAFTMLLAAGASAALPATGLRSRWLRIAPLLAGLVQLMALAPALDFGAMAWSFYILLAAAALFLARRDAIYLPAALAAAGLVLVLEGLALLQPEHLATPIAAAIATLLFALPGHYFTRRAPGWAAIALLGTGGPILVAHAAAPTLLPDALWGALELLASGAAAHLAWRLRSAEGPALVAATALSAFLATLGFAQFLPTPWLALPLSAAMLGLAAWARHARAPHLFALPALPFAAALAAAALPLCQLANLVLQSAAGQRLPYLLLPGPGDLLRTLALPVIAALALLADARQYARFRRATAAIAVTLGVLLLYAVAKQGLAIATLPRFVSLGFVERAVLTQACLATGWLLARRRRLPTLANALVILGVARFAWFDLLMLNPVSVPQSVGQLPLLNAAVVHGALTAFWLWTLAPTRPRRGGAAVATLAAVAVAVRQAAHGDLLAGSLTATENGGYSAALLGAALFWLWRGITAARYDLRIAGLALLTLVTFKVFLIDAAALDGVLRILSFLALGVALIGISWTYGRFLGKGAATPI